MIRAARELLGWTQDKLGLEAGLVRNTVATLERGKVRISPESRARVLEALRKAGVRFVDGLDVDGVHIRGVVVEVRETRRAPGR